VGHHLLAHLPAALDRKHGLRYNLPENYEGEGGGMKEKIRELR